MPSETAFSFIGKEKTFWLAAKTQYRTNFCQKYYGCFNTVVFRFKHGVGKSKNLRILLKSNMLKSKNYCTSKERSWARVQFLSLKSTAHKGSFYIQPLDSRNLRIPAGLYLSSIQLILKEDTMMKEEQIFFSNFSCMFLNPNNFFQFEL